MDKKTDEKWYYIIELEPGEVTDGTPFHNLAITRRLLRNVDVKNRTAIDVGTQEGVIPVLLKKGGAASVTAYDRFDKIDKIDRVRDAYGVEFDYIPGIQLRELPGILTDKKQKLFDLVVFSGVLYHMVNPLGHLALVRGLCKNNGLMLIETMAIRSDEALLHFNAKAAIGGKSSNYFLPTRGWLDYVYRMLMLEPVQVNYYICSEAKDLLRVAVLCRSRDEVCSLDSDDEWMSKPFHRRVFSDESSVDWEAIKENTSEISFTNDGGGFEAVEGRPLIEALNACDPYSADYQERTLSLDSVM